MAVDQTAALEPFFGSDSHAPFPQIWSRRRLVALACAAGALSAAAPLRLLTGRAAREQSHEVGRGSGFWTSFGTVAVVSSTRAVRAPAAVHLDHHDPSVGPGLDRTWSHLVRAEVEVHNGLDRAILLSAGQFRLRLAANGSTVAPYDAASAVAVVEAGRTLPTWVSYLAPAQEREFQLVFTDTGLPQPVHFLLAPGWAANDAGGAQ